MRRRWGFEIVVVLLTACPSGEGKILGDIPGAASGRARVGPYCAIPCVTAADCPTRSDTRYLGASRWICDHGECVGLDCLQTSDPTFDAFAPGPCLDNQCTYACETDSTCHSDGSGWIGREVCEASRCLYRGEHAPPPCTCDVDGLCIPLGVASCGSPTCARSYAFGKGRCKG
jgi:hypothetical protein